MSDAVELARADVLRDIAGQAGGKRHATGQCKHIDLCRGRKARDHCRAAQIDIILDDDVADRNKALLRDRRDGVVGQTAQHFRREEQEMAARVERTHTAQQQQEGEQARAALRDKGRPCNARHAPLEARHKHEVKHHVDDRGQDEQNQRRTAVTHCVKDTGADIIEEQEQQPEHIHAQVERAVGKDVVRRLQRAHDAAGGERADQRQHKRDRRRG